MSFQGFLPSLPTFSPLRIPVLTTCFSESNFNTDLTLKERAKVGPRMQTSVSQKSPQSSNPKWSYQIRQSYMTMSGDFGGFILSMQDFILFFLSTPTQWSLCNDCTFQIFQIFWRRPKMSKCKW